MTVINVSGIPRPGGSKTLAFNFKTKKHYMRDAGKYTAAWRKTVTRAALEQYFGDMLLGPVYMSYEFRFPRPKNHFRTGKFSHVLKDDAPTWHTNTPDLTKIIRSTEDSLIGIVYKDDSQVCNRDELKRYCNDGEEPGVTVTVIEID